MVLRTADPLESLVVLYLLNLDLDIHPAPEIIFHKLVTNIKGIALIDMLELLSLMEGYCRENLEGIFFLDQGELQMLSICSYGPPIPIIHHILRNEYWIVIFRTKGLKLFQDAEKFLIDLLKLQFSIDLHHWD